MHCTWSFEQLGLAAFRLQGAVACVNRMFPLPMSVDILKADSFSTDPAKDPSPKLLVPTQRARFSSHIMTEDELEKMRQAAEGEIRALESSPAAKRLWHRYGKVLC